MTTTARSSRFSNFPPMGHSREKSSQQTIGSSFTSTNWQTGGIWGNSGIGSFKRNTSVPDASDDAFPAQPSGSGALAATSEADPWSSRSAPWNTTEGLPGRSSADNTSPTRVRTEASMHDITNAAYYPSSQSQMQSQMQSTIGVSRAGTLPSRAKPVSSADASTAAFNFGQFSEYAADPKESSSPFGLSKFESSAAFMPDKRSSQDASFRGIGGTVRDPAGLPSPSLSETGAHAQNNMYGEFPYVAHTPNSVNHERSSISGQSLSLATAQANKNAYQRNLATHIDENDLQERLTRGLVLNDVPNGAPNGIHNLASFAGPASFQLNPASQAWDSNSAQAYTASFAKEAYTDGLGAYPKRGSVTELRNSPAGSSYRPSLSSPKSYTGTPQPGIDMWPRPTSRDPRASVAEVDRRGQSFIQPQPAILPPYYAHPPAYYGPNYQPFPTHPYDPYAQHYRQPLPIPGYGLPVNPYHLAGTAGIPLRTGKDQDPVKGARSALLEEFRASSKSNKRFELKDIYNHIVEFSGDQHASRFIQTKLETANSDEKDQVFREIEPNATQLMKDVFGNYVIQKFFEHGNQVQKKVLAGLMKGKVVDLSLQMYSCRVVQKALEHVLVEQQAELIKELEPEVYRVVKDQNGNHVVQKVIELVPRQYIGFIMDCLRGRVSELASHTYGCRVVQRVLEHGTEADKKTVMDELHNCASILITDQYGNYVTQHVIQHGKPEDRSKIIAIVTSQILTLSKHKFASNVVEKCIEYGTPEERQLITEGLTRMASDGSSPLQTIMKDQYGNYVIQKLLSNLQGQEREILVEAMRPQVQSLKKANASSGRQIAAIDRLICAIQPGPAGTKDGTPPSSAPASPALPVDLSSAAPTPNLTTESNSPSSSSPPSTGASAIEEAIDENGKEKKPINADITVGNAEAEVEN